jgi:translation initiation factor 2-alpha kinase 4
MIKTFRHHGAVELNTPLLMPKYNLYEEDKKAVYLIDADGGLVQVICMFFFLKKKKKNNNI